MPSSPRCVTTTPISSMWPTTASDGPPAVPGTRTHELPRTSDETSPTGAAASRHTAATARSCPEGPGVVSRRSSSSGSGMAGATLPAPPSRDSAVASRREAPDAPRQLRRRPPPARLRAAGVGGQGPVPLGHAHRPRGLGRLPRPRRARGRERRPRLDGARGDGAARLLAQRASIASLVVPLAEADLPIFVISTFESDYVLVRSSDLGRAADVARGRRPRLRGLTLALGPAYPGAMTSVRNRWAWRTERGGSLRAR